MGKWEHGTPSLIGWYPTLVCWDPEEGEFPRALYWTGAKWQDAKGMRFPNAAVVWMPGPLAHDVAEQVAFDNDPDNPGKRA